MSLTIRRAAASLALAASLVACRDSRGQQLSPLPGIDPGLGAVPADARPDASPPPGADAETDAARPEPPILPGSPDTDDGLSDGDVVVRGVQALLDAHCGACHADASNGAAFADGLELQALIDNALIVPGSSASSPLLARARDGSMPPGPGRYFFSPGDLALLEGFIDRLRGAPEPDCGALPLLDHDAVYAAMLADVLGRPSEERRFSRYVGLSHASNARLCGAALDEQRQALFKMVNSVSTAETIASPEAIDIPESSGAAALLYRLDLRDYGWAREIDPRDDDLMSQPDGWQVIVAAAAGGALELAGPEASALVAETGAPVPFLPAHLLVRSASSLDAYYALLGMRANVHDTEAELGIDIQAAIQNRQARRAAFFGPTTGFQHVVTRYAQGARPGAGYWQLDSQDRSGAATTILDGPLDSRASLQTIIELPNGLHAYSMNGRDGERQRDPMDCAGRCARPQGESPVGCMACHVGGLLPVVDRVRALLEQDEGILEDEIYADILATYVDPADFQRLIEQANARYLAALEQLDVYATRPEPISRVARAFDAPLDLARAAAELGVDSEALTQALDRLPSVFGALRAEAGAIERAAFGAALREASCVLHASARNRPATCP